MSFGKTKVAIFPWSIPSDKRDGSLYKVYFKIPRSWIQGGLSGITFASSSLRLGGWPPLLADLLLISVDRGRASVESMLVVLYGAPIWVQTVDEDRRRRHTMEQLMRRLSLRVTKAYRTVSHEATAILARFRFVADRLKRAYLRRRKIIRRDGSILSLGSYSRDGETICLVFLAEEEHHRRDSGLRLNGGSAQVISLFLTCRLHLLLTSF